MASRPEAAGQRPARYTTIGELYKHELTLIKLFGGHLFNWNKLPAFAYLLSLFAIKFLLNHYNQVRIGTIELSLGSQAREHKTGMYVRVCYLFWVISQLTFLLTAYKYSQYFNIILNKRLDRRYFFHYKRSHILHSHVNRVKLLMAIAILSTTSSVHIRSEAIATESSRRAASESAAAFNGETQFVSFDKLNATGNDQRNITQQIETQPETLKWALLCLSLNLLTLFQELAYALLAISQSYGHQVMAFMIVAALNDMLVFSCRHDRLTFEAQPYSKLLQNGGQLLRGQLISDVELFSSLPRKSLGGEGLELEFPLKAEAARPGESSGRKRALLTTKLLLQIRQLLMLLQQIISLEFLIVFMFDLSRLSYCFSLVYGQLKFQGNSRAFFILYTEYFRVIMSLSLLRVAYFWLYDSMERLRRFADEIKLIQENSPAEERYLDYSNREVIFRLSGEILFLSTPSNWLKADVKSVLAEQIYVLTVVLTIEQLADVASGRRNYLPS